MQSGVLTTHEPVMLAEVLDYLSPKPGGIIIDCTVGGAGHARMICPQIQPNGQLIGIDQDKEAIEKATGILKEFKGFYTLINDNFQNLDKILAGLKISRVDGILFDLGLSLFQLEAPQRGFSFRYPGPLDMRMDRGNSLKAAQLVNGLSQQELADILSAYGEERWASRIARQIVCARKSAFIATTTQLAEIISKAVPFRRHYRINPATRTFQALRIVVNKELDVLEKALGKAVSCLNPGGRICVISFHSLEDRIVKNQFRLYAKQGAIRIISKKPLVPSRKEVNRNPRARSAKLRVAEHC